MKTLAADIGNSRIKLALFEHGRLMKLHIGSADTIPADREFKTASHFIYASVSGELPEWLLNYHQGFQMQLTHQTAVPIQVAYKSPETLGMDRLAAACGAHLLYPQENLFITDAGSCITYDFVSAQGVYQGGLISPGLQMRMKGMHAFTGRLPDLYFEAQEGYYGVDTRSSMLHGVQQGVLGEYNYIKSLFEAQYSKLRCVITGGDTDFFVKHLKNRIFAHPNLVLQGLNQILHFNVQHTF